MKNQCFGGEYLGEVYDHMLKRSAFRRQKRWWNAYILFYERIDDSVDSITKDLQKVSIGEVLFLFDLIALLRLFFFLSKITNI